MLVFSRLCLIVQIVQIVQCHFFNGDIVVFGDIATFATFASAFFLRFLLGVKLRVIPHRAFLFHHWSNNLPSLEQQPST